MTTPTEADKSLNRRRRFRFSLRSLLTLTTLLCVWLGWQAYLARQQRAVVLYLQELDRGNKHSEIWIGYDRQPKDFWIPAWIRQGIGEDFFQNVVEVKLGNRVTTENLSKVIGQLRRLPKLKTLNVFDASISDEDLRHLTALTQITNLSLLSTSYDGITGAGIRQLVGMDNLESLTFGGWRARMESVACIPQFKHLKSLTLGLYGIGGEGVEQLATCPELTTLNLTSCWCSGSALERVSGIRTLERLWMSNMYVHRFSVPQDEIDASARREEWRLVPCDQLGGPVDSSMQRGSDGNSTGYMLLFDEVPGGGMDFIEWLRSKRPGLEVDMGL